MQCFDMHIHCEIVNHNQRINISTSSHAHIVTLCVRERSKWEHLRSTPSTNIKYIYINYKKQRHYFDDKGPSSKSYSFSNSQMWMWELDHKESWVPKNCFWTVVLEKTLESPLDCKEIQPVHPKGDQSWIFTGRTDVDASILWPADAKNWLIGKDPDAGKDWRQEEKGIAEDEMVW